MKPVTVITGAIAVSIGSVLLTASGHALNNPDGVKQEETKISKTALVPHQQASTFFQTENLPGTKLFNSRVKETEK